MNIIDILLPTIVFTICSLVTVPLLRSVRKTKINLQYFMVAWIVVVFSAAAITVFRIASEYFGQSQSFLQISSANTILAPLSSMFLVDTVSVYMVIALHGYWLNHMPLQCSARKSKGESFRKILCSFAHDNRVSHSSHILR